MNRAFIEFSLSVKCHIENYGKLFLRNGLVSLE